MRHEEPHRPAVFLGQRPPPQEWTSIASAAAKSESGRFVV